MNIVNVKVAALKPYKRNPRKNDGAVDAVAESIRQFGFKVPIVIDINNEIVCGHTRLKAAMKLGLDEVPCVIADDLTPEQVRAFRLVDNKTAELAEWDEPLLFDELAELDVSGFDLDWGAPTAPLDGYEKRKAEFEQRMRSGEISEDDEEYQEFLAKFAPKRTTDDCYTPALVYDAVAGYVAQRYGLEKKDFVRPFYPNGDYQAEKYKRTDVVVDNPPFSIFSEIIKFYMEKGVKFFLFAPHLTMLSPTATYKCAAIVCGVNVIYENGANVCTSFVTNLEACALKSCPELYKLVNDANNDNLRMMRKERSKYIYPEYVVTVSSLSPYARLGIEFEIQRDECAFIRKLDNQKEADKEIFGSGYLISERKKAEREKAEREKAEREKAERWKLSDREMDIIRALK